MSLRAKLGERPDEWTHPRWLRWAMPSGAGLGGLVGAGLGAVVALVAAAATD